MNNMECNIIVLRTSAAGLSFQLNVKPMRFKCENIQKNSMPKRKKTTMVFVSLKKILDLHQRNHVPYIFRRIKQNEVFASQPMISRVFRKDSTKHANLTFDSLNFDQLVSSIPNWMCQFWRDFMFDVADHFHTHTLAAIRLNTYRWHFYVCGGMQTA